LLILETPRLALRHFEPGDLEALYALYRDPEIRRHFPDGTRTLAETEDELNWFLQGHPRFPELGLWATVEKEHRRVPGPLRPVAVEHRRPARGGTRVPDRQGAVAGRLRRLSGARDHRPCEGPAWPRAADLPHPAGQRGVGRARPEERDGVRA
jgi:hypothetical protein